MMNMRNIYFRGNLRSCNYKCSYCSFGKKSISCDEAKEQLLLDAFYSKISRLNESVRIMLLPYGEALIQPYYREFIARLADLPQVEGVSCQTNLSFQPSSLLDILQQQRIAFSKVKLWASFHPEMTTVEAFVDRVYHLYRAGVEFCVGAVGVVENKEIIAHLRSKLDSRIYMFVNALQGRNSHYSTADIQFFTSIDPLFGIDYKNRVADWNTCRGGKDTWFVEASGALRACPRSDVKLGNFFQEISLVTPACNRSRCDCYIAYSNCPGTPLSDWMGEGSLWRIPEKHRVNAIFLDIDGTLTGTDGVVPQTYRKVLAQLAENIPLYLATSLPITYAKHRLGISFSLFSGGIFADGAHLRFDDLEHYVPITRLPVLNEEGCTISRYRKNGHIYKYAIRSSVPGTLDKLMQQLNQEGGYRLYREKGLLTIIDRTAGKKVGLEYICSRKGWDLEKVVAMGDTTHDIPMLSVVGFPCAVLTAEKEVREMARYVMNPDHLALLFTNS